MNPFSPFSHGSQTISLAATAIEVTLPVQVQQVWIDNRGTTDVLVEWYDAPLDNNSFRIAAGYAQPLTAPANCTKIILKRPASSAAETVYVVAGGGF